MQPRQVAVFSDYPQRLRGRGNVGGGSASERQLIGLASLAALKKNRRSIRARHNQPLRFREHNLRSTGEEEEVVLAVCSRRAAAGGCIAHHCQGYHPLV